MHMNSISQLPSDTEAAAEIECEFTGLIIIEESNEQAPLAIAEENTEEEAEDSEFE